MSDIITNFADACDAAADVFEAIPGAWTRNESARNERGRGVVSNDPTACCWCLGGAMKAQGQYWPGRLNAAAFSVGYVELTFANDIGGRKVAIQLLRLAAQTARKAS